MLPFSLTVRQPSHVGEWVQLPYQASRSATIETVLMTLPCPLVGSTARFHLPSSQPFHVWPRSKTKSLKACELLTQTLQLAPTPPIALTPILAHTPIGCGFGSSSSDIFAALKLLLLAHGHDPHRHRQLLIEIALQCDSACDPILFDHPVLFLSRSGQSIRSYRQALPPLNILSFHFHTPIDTSTVIAIEQNHSYSRSHLRQAKRTLHLLHHALSSHNPSLLAMAATHSAELHQALIPFPHFQALLHACHALNALGIAISHSGSAASLLFPDHPSITPAFLDHCQASLLSPFQIHQFLLHASAPTSLLPSPKYFRCLPPSFLSSPPPSI